MKEKAVKKLYINFLIVLLQCLLLAGCGVSGSKEEEVYMLQNTNGQEEVKAENQLSEDSNPTVEAALNEVKASREVVITVGGIAGLNGIQKTVDAFNNSQDLYWVELYKYGSMSELLLDVSRKQGADIYYMEYLDLVSLAEKGVIEELTPYFECSDVVKKENMIKSVLRAGSVGEGMYYVIPRFKPTIYLVEKGYTDNGVWSIGDYLELAEKYPDGMLSEQVTNPKNMLLNDVKMAIDNYIDWETRTCNFTDEEFVQLLERLKSYSTKSYSGMKGYTVAEQLHQKYILTKMVNLSWFPYMVEYKDMRDSLLEYCEIAGMPNDGEQLKYSMIYNEIYGINAGSENKEVAWAFLEYMLSEDYQASLQNMYGGDNSFPARRDVLEESLNAEIGAVPEKEFFHINSYTREKESGISEFTEEDKQIILNIVEHCYTSFAVNTGEIYNIIKEEVAYYFEGNKSAEEVAQIIQNRLSLYLME